MSCPKRGWNMTVGRTERCRGWIRCFSRRHDACSLYMFLRRLQVGNLLSTDVRSGIYWGHRYGAIISLCFRLKQLDSRKRDVTSELHHYRRYSRLHISKANKVCKCRNWIRLWFPKLLWLLVQIIEISQCCVEVTGRDIWFVTLCLLSSRRI